MVDPRVWERGYGREYYEVVERLHRRARPLLQGANAEEATRVIGAAVHDVAAGERDLDEALADADARVSELLGG